MGWPVRCRRCDGVVRPNGRLGASPSKLRLQEKCSESLDCINYSITVHYSFGACVSLYLVFVRLASPEEI